MTFEQQIQQWVKIDDQLKIINEQQKELRQNRNALQSNILEYAEVNNLTNATIKISDGRLKFHYNKQIAPLTLKFVEKCLGEIVNNDEQVNQMMQYIKEQRDIKYTPDIRRNYEH